MLSKQMRFTRAQITSFIADHTVYNKLGTLKYTRGGRKLAVVTSSKHEKRAVVRNKLRRRIYDRFRTTNSSLSGIIHVSKHSYRLAANETRVLFDSLLTNATKNF